VSVSTLRNWVREFVKYGGFLEDLRGCSTRADLMAIFPELRVGIQVYVRTTRSVTVEMVRRFITAHIGAEAERDPSLGLLFQNTI
jgi:hypothetical protein